MLSKGDINMANLSQRKREFNNRRRSVLRESDSIGMQMQAYKHYLTSEDKGVFAAAKIIDNISNMDVKKKYDTLFSMIP